MQSHHVVRVVMSASTAVGPASTAASYGCTTNVQPASSRPAASYPVAASHQAAPPRHEALDGYKRCVSVCYKNNMQRPLLQLTGTQV
jgi:hypothetical protein